MSMSHHEVAEQSRLIEMFRKQKAGESVGEFPDGKISEHDEGEIAFMVGSDPDNGMVLIDFGKPVARLACPPQQAVEFAQLLIRHARGISKEPLQVVLH